DGRPASRLLSRLFRTLPEPAAPAAQRRGRAAQHRGGDPPPHLEGAPSEDLLHGRARPGRLPQALDIFSRVATSVQIVFDCADPDKLATSGPPRCTTRSKTRRRAL